MELDSTTIASIATAPYPAGIGIVRISGPESLSILSSLTKKSQDFFKPRLLRLIWVHSRKGKLIDRAFAVYFPAPFSYSGDDMAEIQCHGGISVLRAVLSAALDSGAILAQPGEFTRRAFLNRRLDLVQAEAVASLIEAPNAQAVENALQQLKGSFSREIQSIKEVLVRTLAEVEASIDFPEEVDISAETLYRSLQALGESLKKLLQKAERGEGIFKRGQVVISGKPNVGKSSLLNALLEREQAIVTSLPETTRDSLEGELLLEGRTIRLVDTAGLSHSGGVLPRLAMKKTRQALSSANLILFLVDISHPPSDEDRSILEELRDRKPLLVGNKVDLGEDDSWKGFPLPVSLRISALKGTNLSHLRSLIEEQLEAEATDEQLWWLNTRQRQLLKRALESCDRAISLSEAPLDIVCSDLREAHRVLGELLGENLSSQVLDSIFSQFCLGK